MTGRSLNRRLKSAGFTVGGIAALILAASTLSRADSNAAPASLKVGTLTLKRCSAEAYCGNVPRPLDPLEKRGKKIPIHFEFYRHSAAGPAAGTIVATEGGPGYPATLSRDSYVTLFKPLMDQRDLIIMDNRGTGQSAAVDCPELERSERLTKASIGYCGRSLGAAAPLFSTAFAVDDLAAILDALKVGRIDLYGDSYGTYFENVFAVRHPTRLRSIVLDGAYPLYAPDYAWYPSYAPAMRAKFNLACQRSAHCSQIPGSSIDHIEPALQMLRAKPFAAQAFNSDGVMREFTADAGQLATVMFASAPTYASLRETDAAARAFAGGDPAPLLRLMAETLSGVDSREPTPDPTHWSSGLAAAVMCQDAPQIFDMRLEPAARAAQFERVIAERNRSKPDTYGPFTIDEFRGLPVDYSFIEQCLEWPASFPAHPASLVVPANAPYPDVPALVISGEYDNITTMADGAAAAKAFPRGRQLIIANSFHVNALPHARSECAAQVVRRFVATLDTGDTSCAAQVPELRLSPDFALSASNVEPASALAGNSATAIQLRCASAAVSTAGDLVARLSSNTSGKGVGLRGGTFTVKEEAQSSRVELDSLRWTRDLSVSGHLDWPGSRGEVSGELHLSAPADVPQSVCKSGELHVNWRQDVNQARVHIAGTIDGAALAADMPAP